MVSFILLVPNYEKFISDSKTGKRLRKDGVRISSGTLRNYVGILELFKRFQIHLSYELQIPIFKGYNIKEFKRVQKYWSKFHNDLLKYLHDIRKVYDNYVGLVIKTLKTFLSWLSDVHGIALGGFYKNMFVRKESIPIITFSLLQMRKLMYDIEFIQILPERLKRSREILVIGCLTGLRFSDLLRINRNDFVERDGNFYLQNISMKTQTSVLIKLPLDAISIINGIKRKGNKLFKSISLVNFNKSIKEVSYLAGWTEIVMNKRTKRGKYEESTKGSKPSEIRFCDLVSSHIMRRTAITNLLTLGVSELVVRKISGHSPTSSSFMKYVNLSQTYLDNELETAYKRLQES